MILIMLINNLIICMLSYLCYKNGSTYYKNRINKHKKTPKIFDIGYKYLPDYHNNSYLLVLINIINCCAILSIYILYDNTIFKEFLYYYTILLIIRGIMTNITILPKIKKDSNKFYWYSLINGHSYDKIFSGHYATLFLTLLFLHNNKNTYTNIISLSFIGIVQAILIILTRSHYTIDIIIAIIVTLFVYLNVPIII
jgi:hypothetical protein